MLFEYNEDDGPVLQWCQGVVIEIVGEPRSKHVIVKIEWKKECLKDGDPKITKQKLLKSKWNIDIPEDGAWREDLYHKILKIN